MCTEYPIVEKAVEAAKKKRRCFGYLFYGDNQKDITCKSIPQFPGITSLLELFAVLEKCWCKETAYPSCQAEWVPNDPSYGQCAITATLVHDMFGGTIHKIKVNGGGTHYFNKINGQYVDLTREPNQEISREYCGKNKDTYARYKQLQRNIISFLNQ